MPKCLEWVHFDVLDPVCGSWAKEGGGRGTEGQRHTADVKGGNGERGVEQHGTQNRRAGSG